MAELPMIINMTMMILMIVATMMIMFGKGDNVDEIIVKVPRETGLMTFSKQKLKLNKNWPYYMYFAFDVVTFCAAI